MYSYWYFKYNSKVNLLPKYEISVATIYLILDISYVINCFLLTLLIFQARARQKQAVVQYKKCCCFVILFWSGMINQLEVVTPSFCYYLLFKSCFTCMCIFQRTIGLHQRPLNAPKGLVIMTSKATFIFVQ